MDFTELERSSFLLLQLERRTYRTILMSENVCDFIIVTKCLGIAHGRTHQGMKTQRRFPNCSKPNLNMKGLEHGSHCSEQPLHGRECSQASQGGPKQRTTWGSLSTAIKTGPASPKICNPRNSRYAPPEICICTL